MAITNHLENFCPKTVEAFVQKAEALTPTLIQKTVFPVSLGTVFWLDDDWVYQKKEPIAALNGKSFGKGERICVDFGDHRVGYLSFTLSSIGSPPDAPAYLRLKFGEKPCEIGEESENYQGSISSSWIQEETLHVDVLPASVRLPRRYAFRYLEILIKDTSPKYRVTFSDIRCETVTSADIRNVSPLDLKDADLIDMDRISIKTMEDCMQSVFEDGPKRDRRLWIGDLRLQALANYRTFQNYDLVKRCLYLFAGLTQNRGRVGACLFLEPKPMVDDTALFDYSLFFVSCLFDYYKETGDRETLLELWDTAYRQIELSSERIGEHGVVLDSDDWWCFLDWNDELNKQAGAQAVFLYTLKQARYLAEEIGDADRLHRIDTLLLWLTKGAKEVLWDETEGFFVSGTKRQISWASQVWFVLAGVFEKSQNQALLRRLLEKRPKVGMVTPYMYHHFIEALFCCEMRKEAIDQMKRYWGGMVKEGADCFYEIYDPDHKDFSPYGSKIIHSYCHAWSGTPTYFIRKYVIP